MLPVENRGDRNDSEAENHHVESSDLYYVACPTCKRIPHVCPSRSISHRYPLGYCPLLATERESFVSYFAKENGNMKDFVQFSISYLEMAKHNLLIIVEDLADNSLNNEKVKGNI